MVVAATSGSGVRTAQTDTVAWTFALPAYLIGLLALLSIVGLLTVFKDFEEAPEAAAAVVHGPGRHQRCSPVSYAATTQAATEAAAQAAAEAAQAWCSPLLGGISLLQPSAWQMWRGRERGAGYEGFKACLLGPKSSQALVRDEWEGGWVLRDAP